MTSDDEADDTIFTKEKRGAFAAGLDAFLVALRRCCENPAGHAVPRCLPVQDFPDSLHKTQ